MPIPLNLAECPLCGDASETMRWRFPFVDGQILRESRDALRDAFISNTSSSFFKALERAILGSGELDLRFRAISILKSNLFNTHLCCGGENYILYL